MHEDLALTVILLAAAVGGLVIFPAILAERFGQERGRRHMWPLGILFGLFGPGIVLLLPRGSGRRCPSCDEWIRAKANVCKHCGTEVPK